MITTTQYSLTWEHFIKLHENKNVVFEKYNDYPNLVRIMDNDKLIAIYEYDDVINCYRAARVWN